MWRRVWAVIQKEFIQTLRDRRTLLIELSLPLIQLFLFGYAIRMNVENVPTVVADQSLDATSNAYVQALQNSGYFDVQQYVTAAEEVVAAIDAGEARAGVVIPPELTVRAARNEGEVLFLVDGSDLFTAQSAYNAANAIAHNHAVALLLEKVTRSGQLAGERALAPLDTRARILYNPNLDDLWFIIPGLLAMLLQSQTVTMTAAAVVREREAGTIEQLLVTPIRPGELLLGKLMPNLLIGMLNFVTIAGLGIFWFGVPFRGNFWLLFWLAFMYVFSGLGLGLLVSTVSSNQRQSQQLSAMLTLLGVVLGGFIFPRYTMPQAIRLVGNLFPMTYFIPIARAVFSKGVGVVYFWEEVVALFFYICVIMIIAARAFREQLD